MSSDTLLLTYSQTAKELSVSLATVDRLVANGDLIPVRLPRGGPRIRRADLEQLVNPQQT